MNILKLVGQLILDGTKYKAGLREAQSLTTTWSRNLASGVRAELAAAFGSAAFIKFVKDSVSYVGALKDLAEQSRLTTAEVQRMTVAAEHSDLTFENIAMAERGMNRARREAVESSKELREVFAKYGMTIEDVNDPSLRFVDILEKIKEARKGMTKDQLASSGIELADMLGKTGPKLEGFLTELDKVKDTPVISDKSIEAVDRADDKIKDTIRNLRTFYALMIEKRLSSPWWTNLSPFQGASSGRHMRQVLKEMMGGKKEEKKSEPGSVPTSGTSDPEADGSRVDEEKKREGMYKDKIAEKEKLELLKREAELQKAIFKVQLEMLGASDQRSARERELIGLLDEIHWFETQGADAIDQRVDAVKKLGELASNKSEPLGVSPLTAVGQWDGRSMIASESQIVRTAKEQLGFMRQTAQAVTQLNGKVRAGQTLEVRK